VHVFYTIPHTGLSVGDPYTIPVYISRGMVRYRLSTTIIELRCLLDPIKSTCGQYCSSTCSGFHYERSSINTGEATTFEPRISTSLSSTFPSNDTTLFPICLVRSQIKTSNNSYNKNHSKITSVKRGVLHASGTYHSTSIVV
jgi:hypothetical protein